ncbi:8-oxo-dGTP diphosphatase MutT [Ferrimonas marina]|uniref:8-oxo-dGTP diphosphatase n=1 Tax=Ferrimonas marina TaxID=299255 RepID=A0A1M5XGX0_9GAMM|nr:8-oxo-dGTP diphosphatase MutT [Ferrimonas marina]SHH98493.1 8-oxo-dGTP diphosphatase [Ferrimonas marina]
MTIIQVAIGVVLDSQQRVLVAKRKAEQHQGGLWEFPGGKVDAGEGFEQALARELEEEVGLTVLGCEPLHSVTHDYGDRTVQLATYLVTEFDGEAQPKEGNPLQWVPVTDLPKLAMPAANQVLIQALLQRLA